MKINLSVAGRYLFAVPVFIFGLFHLMNGDMIAESLMPGWMPLKIFFIYLTGAGLIAASVPSVIKLYARLAGLLAGALMVAGQFKK